MPVVPPATKRLQYSNAPYPEGQSYRRVVAAMHGFLHDLAAHWNGSGPVIRVHSANVWILEYFRDGTALEDLVDAPFGWQEGWLYVLTTHWVARISERNGKGPHDDN